MRSAWARLIFFFALMPIISSILSFFQRSQTVFHFGSLESIGGAWIMLGQELIAPVGLIAAAAMVEMLSRISQSLGGLNNPATQAASPAWPWRSGLAKALLVVAAATYVVSAYAMIQFILGGGAEGLGVPASDALEQTFSMLFYWITAPVPIIAMAAIVEYLVRISASLEQRAGPAP